MKQNNLFINDDKKTGVITRLNAYGNTVIKFMEYLKFGERRILEDIYDKSGLRCKLKVCYDTHVPSNMKTMIWSPKKLRNKGRYILRPVMPIVKITVITD